VDVPVVFTTDRVFALPLGSLSGIAYRANGVSDNGNTLGVQSPQADPLVWVNVVISGSSITASRQDLLSANGSSIPATEALHMGADGTIVGAQADGKALYWDNEGYVANALNTPDGKSAVAYAVSDDGKKFAGLINPSATQIDLGYWETKTIAGIDVTPILPASEFTQLAANFILADGSFIALGKDAGSSVRFVYIKKK
jgi:hypothetical protein